MTEFEVNKVIMPLYIDSAQVYLQLSIGALALSIAFKEKVLGEEGAPSLLPSCYCYPGSSSW